MSRHESLVRLRHMLDHAREAVAMAKGKTRDSLYTDRMLNLALVRLLEIVGEAASRTPPEERAQYGDIPWPGIVGLRNRLIHGYELSGLRNLMADHQPRPANLDCSARADRFVSMKFAESTAKIPACLPARTVIAVIL